MRGRDLPVQTPGGRRDAEELVVVGAGRSGVHAEGQRIAHDLLDRDDPDLDLDRVHQQRDRRRDASLWALVSGHWSAWQAARVEVLQDEEARKRQQEDVPQEVVERIVDETEVSRDRSSGAPG